MVAESVHRVLDPDYPAALRELPSPPDPLWIRGSLPDGPAVAIVGTRSASPEAIQFARRLGRLFAEAGVAVYSGGALGIDSAAHEGALEGEGATVVVTGTGLDHVFPKENAELFEKIVNNGGAIVSPFEREQRGARWTFLKRNPVLAVLTEALILVEAPIRSGARSASMAARRLGRPLFVVPAAPWDVSSAGAFLELSLGATPLTNEADIFATLGLAPPALSEPLLPIATTKASGHGPKPRSRSPQNKAAPAAVSPPAIALPSDLPGPAKIVWEATSEHPLHADELCVATGLSTAVVHEALLTLTLHAVLVEGPSGSFRRISS